MKVALALQWDVIKASFGLEEVVGSTAQDTSQKDLYGGGFGLVTGGLGRYEGILVVVAFVDGDFKSFPHGPPHLCNCIMDFGSRRATSSDAWFTRSFLIR